MANLLSFSALSASRPVSSQESARTFLRDLATKPGLPEERKSTLDSMIADIEQTPAPE